MFFEARYHIMLHVCLCVCIEQAQTHETLSLFYIYIKRTQQEQRLRIDALWSPNSSISTEER